MSNLDKCWKNCLRMWKWVSENSTDFTCVAILKRNWLQSHRFKKQILAYCFFCQWAGDRGENHFNSEKGCPECPGALVDARFKCGNIRYDYSSKPKAFYRKLVALDKKRRNQS